MRDLLFSITKKDFEVSHIKGSGAGGQHRNKVSTGVRIKHKESGAVGQATDNKSQHVNKKNAFNRMYNSDKFQKWYKLEIAKHSQGYNEMLERIEKSVDEAMQPENITVETF